MWKNKSIYSNRILVAALWHHWEFWVNGGRVVMFLLMISSVLASSVIFLTLRFPLLYQLSIAVKPNIRTWWVIHGSLVGNLSWAQLGLLLVSPGVTHEAPIIWWIACHDSSMVASHVCLPLSRCSFILKETSSDFCTWRSRGAGKTELRCTSAFWANLSHVLMSHELKEVLWPYLYFRREQTYSLSLFLRSVFSLFVDIWLHWVLIAACRIFSCGMWILSCSMWDLVLWPGIKWIWAPCIGSAKS